MVRQRMTGKQRREQLIAIGRSLFAERGFEGTSVEEIALRAGVSKPVVYEHFGGKEGLYAVVVDREMNRLETTITRSMVHGRSRARIEQAVIALLTYVEDETDGFQILGLEKNFYLRSKIFREQQLRNLVGYFLVGKRFVNFFYIVNNFVVA